MPSTSELVNALVHFSTTCIASSLGPAIAVDESEMSKTTVDRNARIISLQSLCELGTFPANIPCATRRSEPRSGPCPGNNASAHTARKHGVGLLRGRNRKGVALDLEKPGLLGAVPTGVPRKIDMSDEIVISLDPKDAGVSHHGLEKRRAVAVFRRWCAIRARQDRHHPSLIGMDQITRRIWAEHICKLARVGKFELDGFQFPNANQWVVIALGH